MSLKKNLLKIAELYYKKENKENLSSHLRIVHPSKSKGDDEFGYYNNWVL